MPFLLMLLWILFNGKATPEVLAIGLVSSLAVYGFCCRYMGYNPKTDLKIIKILLNLLVYAVILVKETAIANMKVSRIVFSRQIEIEPQIISFRIDLKTQAARTVLANSITLTPGTITVSLEDNLFRVHCINSQMAEDLKDSALVRQLQKMERSATGKERS